MVLSSNDPFGGVPREPWSKLVACFFGPVETLNKKILRDGSTVVRSAKSTLKGTSKVCPSILYPFYYLFKELVPENDKNKSTLRIAEKVSCRLPCLAGRRKAVFSIFEIHPTKLFTNNLLECQRNRSRYVPVMRLWPLFCHVILSILRKSQYQPGISLIKSVSLLALGSRREGLKKDKRKSYLRCAYQYFVLLSFSSCSALRLQPKLCWSLSECSKPRINRKRRTYRARDIVSSSIIEHLLSPQRNLMTHIEASNENSPRTKSKPDLTHSTYNNVFFSTRDEFFPVCNRDRRSMSAIIFKLLRCSGNVEPNPGPGDQRSDQRMKTPKTPQLMVKSYNVRGLNDENKLRHLLNSLYKAHGNSCNNDSIISLQETYIESAGKIPYLWRGNYVLTAGNGHSCGCITLLSGHINVVESRSIGSRAHVAVCQRSNESQASYIVANLYAPNPNNNDKIEFFNTVFDTVHELSEKYNCA